MFFLLTLINAIFSSELIWLGAILVVSNFATIIADGPENKDSLMAVSNGMNQFATEFYQVRFSYSL